ncbi:ABC transporter substrate-binding protein [Xanthobacter pseudotagetidis]|uniref:ABC transporter substrate-binding protein n=1 Tax=Xanthobacter pseudotagetidis TaxID=3119911 RepID=UPI0037288D20
MFPKRNHRSTGANGLRAVEGTTEKINTAGGIAGRKVALVVAKETNAKEAPERARRLMLQERVASIQVGYATGVTLPMAPTPEDMQVLTIFWDGTTQDGVKETMPSPKYAFKILRGRRWHRDSPEASATPAKWHAIC